MSSPAQENVPRASNNAGSLTASPSILLIIPYFGKLPSYSNLFFRSCGQNPSVNWLLITDQEVDKDRLPQNVSVRKATLADTKASIDHIMGFPVALPNPYKLCDFRPAYGVIFAEEVAGFDFWGYCDMDVVFGQIRAFITDDILRRYDKVLINGHFSLYRNCEEANNYFRLDTPGISFRDVFTSPKSAQFDESGGIERILEHHRIPFFRDHKCFADIDHRHYDLRTVYTRNYRHQYFYWEKGKVFRGFYDADKLAKQEYLYIHLQKRPMTQMFSCPAEDLDAWYITPRSFLPKVGEPRTLPEIERLNERSILFDCKQYAYSSLWHLKSAMLRKIQM